MSVTAVVGRRPCWFYSTGMLRPATAQATRTSVLVLVLAAALMWVRVARAQGPALDGGPGQVVTTPRAPTATPARIAVIDIRGDGVGGELAQELAVALGKQAGVTSIADPAIAAALVGPIVEEDTRAIADASRALQASRDELARFERASAVAQAALGQRLLFDTAPSPATTALLADLAFAEGVAELSEPSDRERAGAAFALVHRLVPGRTLDPARYLPEIVTAFAAAAAAPAGRATLAITGDGTLWLDGRAVGPSPATVSVAPGDHVAIAFGPGRLARGARISVPVDGLAQINLPAAPASRQVQTVRARRALIGAPDAATRATAMVALARLIGATAAVLVTRDGRGELATQLWRNQAPGFGQVRTALPGPGRAEEVLTPLVPPPPVVVVRPPLPPRPPVPAGPPWYRRRWAMASMAGGALAALATTIVLMTGPGPDIPVETNISTADPARAP